jgi:hypothetical protein
VHIFRLAARAPCLRAPVTSTLGRVSRSSCVYTPCRHQQPSGASSRLGKSSLRGLGLRQWLEPDLNLAALREWRLWHTDARSGSQFHGRAAFGRFHPLRQGRAGGAGKSTPAGISRRRAAWAYLASPLQLRLGTVGLWYSTRPNKSFNRTANGRSPWPRGAFGSSCTARPRRPPAVGRLTLR